MGDELVETCRFFVDDSNIWIEAQKYAASGNSHLPKLKDSGGSDPRLRIDVGKLVTTLRKDRRQGPSILYGSRPPPNDLVWKMFERHEFETKIYERARGKEKEVDNSMASDLSKQATELKVRAEYSQQIEQEKANTTFVVITGDRDMLPPIEIVLASKIRVEVWAWESGMSQKYFQLAHKNGLLSLHYLNEVFSDISFTAYRSTRKGGHVDTAKTVVLCGFVDPDDDNLEPSICGQLMELERLFFITRSRTGLEIFVEFPYVKSIEAMIGQARILLNDLTVLSWPEYSARFNTLPSFSVKTGNTYHRLAENDPNLSLPLTAKEESHPAECEPTSSRATEPSGGYGEIEGSHHLNDDPDDSDGWQTVGGADQRKRHRSAMRRKQPCPDRLRCKLAKDCYYNHTNAELALFQEHPRQDFTVWKTRKCVYVSCRRGKRCPFAHSPDEAWCRWCKVEGHYDDACPYRPKGVSKTNVA